MNTTSRETAIRSKHRSIISSCIIKVRRGPLFCLEYHIHRLFHRSIPRRTSPPIYQLAPATIEKSHGTSWNSLNYHDLVEKIAHLVPTGRLTSFRDRRIPPMGFPMRPGEPRIFGSARGDPLSLGREASPNGCMIDLNHRRAMRSRSLR